MNKEFERNISNILDAVTLGHQMGQWSERRWWGHKLDGKDKVQNEMTAETLADKSEMAALVENPPFISTPGWGPTGFADNIPHILGLVKEYRRHGVLTPERFRDFLLDSRDWLLPQGVGRSCLELMAEGMNPRIAGLYASSVVSGIWMSWPVGLYNAGCPDDAYEDAVSLCRTLNGGDIVELSGAWAAALSVAAVPGAMWEETKKAMINKLCRRNPKAYALIIESLRIGETAADDKALISALRGKSFFDRTCKLGGLDWMQSCYSAAAMLEYAFRQQPDWTEFMRIGLQLPDTRFGPMLFCGIYAALNGAGWPSLWNESLEKVHKNERTEALEAICSAVEIKLCSEKKIAHEAAFLAGTGEIEHSELYDRILAGMLAGMAANAMGSPVEDRDYQWITQHYGVVDKILDSGKFETEDDSAMALMWADTLIECRGRIYPEDLAAMFKGRMNPENFYYDSKHAYNLLMDGIPPHACGHWNVVTGSALMGCNVVGMYHACDTDRARIDGLELSYHYQRGFDVHAAAILCAATAEALRDKATVGSVIEAAINAAPEKPQKCFDELSGRNAREVFRNMIEAVKDESDVLKARQKIYDSFYAYNGQDPWEVAAYILAVFKVADGDVWRAALGGTNIGRDSDTIACQAALLSACMSGMKGVPDSFLSMYDDKKMARCQSVSLEITLLVREKCAHVLRNFEKICKNIHNSMI
ncbi:MAG: ADP-ribosylglycohydrolase family protein [Oscillospiraceae bacterium]|nr:ADP-ribosylglycohydrolase family protein [Oscillospiraceae bacterium]